MKRLVTAFAALAAFCCSSFGQSQMHTFNSIDEMVRSNPYDSRSNAVVTSYNYWTGFGGSGIGGGLFTRERTLTAPTNTGTCFAFNHPSWTSVAGRWVRKVDGPLTPLMFGARADGVTDDLPAFQACWDQAKTNSLSVYVPGGNYLISGTWVLDGTATPANLNGCSVFGDGPGRTAIFQKTTNTPAILITNCHNGTFYGIQIASTPAFTASSGLIVAESTYLLFDNIQVISCKDHGMYFKGGPSTVFSVQIRGSLFANSGTNIFSDKATISSLTIGPANEIRGLSNTNGIGIHVSGYVTSIQGNVIETLFTGINVVGGLGDTEHVMSIRENYFENNSYSIRFVNDDSVKPVLGDGNAGVVYGCVIQDNRFNTAEAVFPIYSEPEPAGNYGLRVLGLKLLDNVYSGTPVATNVNLAGMAAGGLSLITDVSYNAGDAATKYHWGNHAASRVYDLGTTIFQPYPDTEELVRIAPVGIQFGGTSGGYLAKDTSVYGGASIFSDPVIAGQVLDFSRYGVTNLTIERQLTNYTFIATGVEGVDYVFTNDTRHIVILNTPSLLTTGPTEWLFASYNYRRGSDSNVTVFGDLIGKGTNAFYGPVRVEAQTNAYALAVAGARMYTNDWTGIRNGTVSADGAFDTFKVSGFAHSIGGNPIPASGIVMGQSNRTYTGVSGYVDIVASDSASGTPTSENRVARFMSDALMIEGIRHALHGTNVNIYDPLITHDTNLLGGNTLIVGTSTNAHALILAPKSTTLDSNWVGVASAWVSADNEFPRLRIMAQHQSSGGNQIPAAGLVLGQIERNATGVSGYVDVITGDMASGTPLAENRTARFSATGLSLPKTLSLTSTNSLSLGTTGQAELYSTGFRLLDFDIENNWVGGFHTNHWLVNGPIESQSAYVTNELDSGSILVRTNINVVGKVQVVNGSAAAPPITFTNDTSSGLYLASSYVPAITRGGADAMVFYASDTLANQPINLKGYARVSAPEDGGLMVDNNLATIGRLRIDGSAVALNDAATNAIFVVSVATNTVCGLYFHYTVRVVDAAFDQQSESGTVNVTAVNVGSTAPTGTMTIASPVETSTQALASGTLTTAWTAVQDGNALVITLTPDTSLTPTAMSCTYELLNSYGAVTAK